MSSAGLSQHSTRKGNSDSNPRRDTGWLARLIAQRAAAIQHQMQTAEAATVPEVRDGHFRNARVLAREIAKAVDGHFRTPATFRYIRPIMGAHRPAYSDGLDVPMPAVSHQCVTCSHWYPITERRSAQRGNCRKPMLATRVQAGRGQWPAKARAETCEDWQRSPAV